MEIYMLDDPTHDIKITFIKKVTTLHTKSIGTRTTKFATSRQPLQIKSFHGYETLIRIARSNFILLMKSQHFSPQINYHQAILEEYENGDWNTYKLLFYYKNSKNKTGSGVS
jgi:hypothetical protein